MKIIFKKILIHNFMSFGDDEFNFDSLNGMTRIRGKNFDIPNQLNGSGKSNLFCSLVYGLYGEMPFKLKNDNIYNRYLKDKNTNITVFFCISGKEYKVISGLKGKQSYCDLFEVNDKGEYENITRSTIAETRKYIERDILHCDKNLFMRTIYLNSDRKYDFYDLKEAEKKEFIDKLFDISIFGDMYNLIHRDVLRLEKDISAHQNRLIILNKNSDEYSKKSLEFNSSNDKKIDEVTKKLEETNELLSKKRESSIKKNTEIENKIILAISKLNKNISDIESEINEISRNSLRVNDSIKVYTSSIRDKQKIIDKHSELNNRLCDDCKPIFSRYYSLDKFKSEIDSLNEKISKEETKKSGFTEQLNNLNIKKTEFIEKLNKLNEKLTEMTSEYNKNISDIRNLELCVNSLETQLSNIKSQSNPFLSLKEDNDKKITDENTELLKISNTYKYSKKAQEIVDQENLKKFIIKDLIGLLNNKIKFYLHKLGANHDIVFDENMKYDFITQAKEGIEYNNFSKGEQARISIATCFAFRDFLSTRSRITSNILILDEFFDTNVDPIGIENTMDILKTFVRNSKQKIYVVSHRTEVSDDSFNNIVQVEKNNNISKIKYL